MSKIEVVEKTWPAAKFTINIVQLPVEVISDKLAILSDGSGTLSFSRYDTFLLNNCIIDVEKIIKFLDGMQNEPESMIDAAMELRQLILDVNPLLDPELLVINNENIIRIAEQTDTLDKVRRLVDNSEWDTPEFDGPSEEDIENFITSMPPPSIPFGKGNGVGNPDQMVPHLWDETDLLLVLVEYDVNDIPEIFKDHTTFEDEEVYKQFVVTRCIHDFQNLFILLDRMGYTKKFGAEKLTDMLYDISIQHNTFLAWEDIDLEKVKRVVKRKYGNRTPQRNKFKKKNPDDPKEEGELFGEFADVPEEDILTLGTRVMDWVIGQDEIIEEVRETIELAKCGLKDPDTPIGTFIFTGGTGTGKTYSSRMFAQELCGDEHAITRIDCSEYSQKHEISKLIGAPSGYVGFEEGGCLTNALMKRPFTVVLFDEIEKAHSSLHNILLQIMDEGRLTSNKGETVSFGEALIILTSNVGVKEVENIGSRIGVGNVATMTKSKQEKAIQEALKNQFKPEFLNRLDGIVTFNSLTKEHGIKI
ncbi:MAG: ATP-dependent Clp protease ATP-binding subunit, partial [Candidatus Peribacteraceae bacterium]|nr:ATP-dependent Clp protease ATP-binding subunit [Candidatus Peribacteraceae bacterium]